MLGGNTVDVYRNQRAGGGLGVVGSMPCWRSALGERLHELSQFGILIGKSGKGDLPGECVLKFTGQCEPLLGWSGREITERTNYPLSRPFVGEDGLDQQVIYIRFILYLRMVLRMYMVTIKSGSTWRKQGETHWI